MAGVIEITELSKEYRPLFGLQRLLALDKLSLEIERGELFGLLGPNGAGKTTCVKLLLGLIFPTGGEMKILGRTIHSPAIKRQIGYLPEGSYFPDFLKGEEVLRFYGRLYGLRGTDLERRIDETLETVGLSHARRTLARYYSKGMRQRVGLGQALLSEPAILILDEPTTGLDPIARREIRDILIQLKEQDRTLLICSHELLEVEMMCDRVGILNRGRLVECGSVSSLVYSDKDVEVLVRGVAADKIAPLETQGVSLVDAGRDTHRLVISRERGVLGVLQSIESAGGTVVQMSPRKESLEDIFIRSVREHKTEPAQEKSAEAVGNETDKGNSAE